MVGDLVVPRLSCVGGFVLLLWALYQLRLQQLQRQFNMTLDARVGERTRIARELHDTLLQSLHGLMFRFQAARNMLPGRPEEAMQALDGAIARTEQAITESRDAIRNLRSEPVAQSDLAQLLTAMGQELAGFEDANPNWSTLPRDRRGRATKIVSDPPGGSLPDRTRTIAKCFPARPCTPDRSRDSI